MDNKSLLNELADRRQFILYRVIQRADGKTDKLPIDASTGEVIDAHDSTKWLLPADALSAAQLYGEGFGVALVITEGCGILFLDLDHCLEGDQWAPYVVTFLMRFPQAAREISVSGTGIHLFIGYRGAIPEHGTRNKDLRMEAYSKLRFAALTGNDASGSVFVDYTAEVAAFLTEFFPVHGDGDAAEWTEQPVTAWHGPTDDTELVRRAMRSRGAMALFGRGAAFGDLWNGNADVLARAFPPQSAHQTWDGSAADQALCNHLAFWTGNDCERMLRILTQCKGLQRPKWERADYLRATILHACASQREWYDDSGSEGVPGQVPTASSSCVDRDELGTPSVPVAPLPPPPIDLDNDDPLERGALLTSTQQQELFAGVCYVQDIHRMQMPNGLTLNKEQFDVHFGGRQFVVNAEGDTEKSAWNAFTQSGLFEYPQVRGQFFNPQAPVGSIAILEGHKYVNSWFPIEIRRVAGDPAPFVEHVRRLLPRGQDADLLVYYMAAIVQNPGQKFQWAPLIQGVEGNGKTMLSEFLQYAVGLRYTHWPKAAELGGRFNAPFYAKLLICVEDVFIPEAKMALWEALKPMITGKLLEIEQKGIDKVTREICFNFMLNTNHKDGLKKTRNDRRLAPFFCAQQLAEDKQRDGLTPEYFRKFRAWRDADGYAIVADYLLRLAIPDELNPARNLTIAPQTTSTLEALRLGHGTAEQEIIEAIKIGAPGFRGGWISSLALDQLLQKIGKANAIPRGARESILAQIDYIPHPALPDGYVPQRLTDGTQPRIFVRNSHLWNRVDIPAVQIVAAYMESQK